MEKMNKGLYLAARSDRHLDFDIIYNKKTGNLVDLANRIYDYFYREKHPVKAFFRRIKRGIKKIK